MKNTALTFRQAKEKGEKLTMLTCYDYSTAKLMDESGVNSLLVGDSLGMVMMGYENTLAVTMEDMIHHTKCVSRGAKNALVIGDMPFLSYHTSVYDAVVNAGRLIKEGGAQAVKLEGGADMAETVAAIVRAQIPVCGHIGLTPQSINAFGGFKVQGKTVEAAQKLLDDAKRLEDAGCFAVVLECIPELPARQITESLSIPTVGIGAGKYCDGQVLVYQDMLGLYSDVTPKFVRKFADCGTVMREAFRRYIEAVNEGSFPSAEHTFRFEGTVSARVS
ncbi:3-methyl-2-oxobutanoate hydroxymethyltransferase [Papillibacter cinnamivorans]|uniref:3-methyl-2-oxobutanoate hydroxymethyltransferase n=1 Tax=Papillibacter cinnamivorans DSM 12816 TaxID=1122930 RepID=A0A1W2A6Z4_9FIRM|nr:3-methyl-2-oxobutanoate hydroxymethyltransferase [Papillibacter cinnamivorans]SMC56191.1 3-methyl-2-oxobutanoate hydroxymethyltransferase [Papillibacter cinnamivorans DSM 12816]